MLQKVDSLITGKSVLLLLILANGVYFTMLAYSIPKLMSLSGGLPLFDMSPMGYDYEAAVTLLNALGSNGRDIYLSLQLVLDLFYPFLFGLCYFALLQWLIRVGQLKSHRWLIVSLIPILVCLFDYAENIGIWLMLTGYPELSMSLVSITSLLTIIKSSLTMLYFSGLMVVIGLVAWSKLSRQTVKAKG